LRSVFDPKTGLIYIDIAMLKVIFPFDKPTGGFIINNISINREQDAKKGWTEEYKEAFAGYGIFSNISHKR
jgi:hypothetical protein